MTTPTDTTFDNATGLDPARWSTGARRRLQRVTTPEGHFAILAVDHRDALRKEFDADDPNSVPASTLTTFKSDMVSALGDAPSATMLESEYSLPDLFDRGDVHPRVGVFGALESQGYLTNPDGSASVNDFMPDWSADQLLRMGGDGAKILVLYRHDRGEHTEAQDRFVAAAVRQAHDAGLPMLVEPVPYGLEGAEDRRVVCLESARRLAPIGPMILKAPFPGNGACAEYTELAAPHPWILLSWGVPFEEFRDQVEEAVEHGCSGFAVGRALWREALAVDSRPQAIEELVRPRFAELSAIVKRGRSATEVVSLAG